MVDFTTFDLDPNIVKSLENMGFKNPTPIQEKAIPIILKGNDLLALAQTGSGKTAACAIPVCHLVDINNSSIQALIIVPTRELASQYAIESQKIGKDRGVKVFSVYGGEDSSIQIAKLKHEVQVLVATPGRLIDFIYSRNIDLTHVKILILDEADEMLSMGFYDDLNFIMQCLMQDHQTLLFSATMPKQIQEIAKRHMKVPVEVKLTSEQVSPKQIDHRFLYCHHKQRDRELIKLIKDLDPKQCLIFCHSRIQVEKVCRELKKYLNGIDFLHAGLSQDVRKIITSKFRSGKISCLVSTDVTARGLDFTGISHVFIYQLSDDPELYVHRSGRTGRYDRAGMVVTLVTDRDLHKFRRVIRLIKLKPHWIGKPPPTHHIKHR